jgi:hypothetical protein
MTHGMNTDHPDWWAIEHFMKVGEFGPTIEEAMDAILAVLKLNPSDKVIAVLAAGPLEDLIADHGPEVIDKIEKIARQNLKFKHLLGGAWESGKPGAWERVTACRGEIW